MTVVLLGGSGRQLVLHVHHQPWQPNPWHHFHDNHPSVHIWHRPDQSHDHFGIWLPPVLLLPESLLATQTERDAAECLVYTYNPTFRTTFAMHFPDCAICGNHYNQYLRASNNPLRQGISADNLPAV